ncbi:BatA domain-containing protein [Taibaiella soli]|uniref:Aerotolerance regulator N-terminal domain-containing protein n=1 Tax=Taibaiella soli TaxID=1649169 RepID=A0A2W2AZ07_9BACT|nr:BatA domain-containing protein [Taibaiella soli]PZF72898.1 hypothetical protein DN068_10825 [Taibaiella soli]
MSFLYPLFLVAGLSLAIPVIIHLFNLRRYKTVLFPHTRFLKDIQLNSRKQSQIRYKWLLALRLLFLASLILAFAQPFLNKNTAVEKTDRLQVIYIDNSNSMALKKGARSLLDIAKEAAQRQIRNARPGSKFLLLSNDKPASYQPMQADKTLMAIRDMSGTSASMPSAKILTSVQSLMQSESQSAADLYYYSDFQQTAFSATPDQSLLRNIQFHGIPVQVDAAQNIYIDTAYLLSPVLLAGQNNQIVVRTKAIGTLPKESPILQLTVNGQVKSAASLGFDEQKESIDTVSFQPNDASWQKIALTINDASVRFDDTFRITARSAPGLSVLVLNESQVNPYIQAAFRAYNGFRLTQSDISAAPTDFKDYNLVILNGITRLDAGLAKNLSAALQKGQSICIFPAKTGNFDALNEGLQILGDIRIAGVDTATQTVAGLQQGNDLVKDLFERIPENVQLPVANWHYIVHAGLNANQQSVLSFRNGDPFLAGYHPYKGALYICASAIDQVSGNFQGSYFFVPFLYQMAAQSKGSDIYAISVGAQQPAWLPLNNADERNMVHIQGDGLDLIPPQRPNGAGLDVFVDQVLSQPGFYKLVAQGTDPVWIALNGDREESNLEVWTLAALKNQWKGDNIKWQEVGDTGSFTADNGWRSFPLWKVCVILALFVLVAETLVLAGSFRKSDIAAQ